MSSFCCYEQHNKEKINILESTSASWFDLITFKENWFNFKTILDLSQCIYSSHSFIKNNCYINHNVAFCYFLFVIKTYKDAIVLQIVEQF